MAKAKEYCVKAELNPSYTMFILGAFGGYSVLVKSGEHVYSVYGPYRNLGTAANRLKRSADSYKTNPVSYYWCNRETLLKTGALAL